MSLHSYALTTLAKVKAMCGIESSTTTYDDFLENMINAMTDKIEKICSGRRFANTTYTNERYDGNGEDKLYLRQYPIILISACTINNESISEAIDYDDYDGYWIEPIISGIKFEGCLYRIDKWDQGWQNVKITYNAGYSTIPGDLDVTCQIAVRALYNLKKNEGDKKSESIGRYSYTFDSLPKNVKDEIMEVLNNYIPMNY